jgi:hypothetical protein
MTTATSTPPKAKAPEYTLVLRAPGPDPDMRLKQALKVLGRRFGLQCISGSSEQGS